MQNSFFIAALRKAAMMAGKPGRLIMLLTKLTSKLRDVNWKNVDAVSVKGKFFVLGRLIKAYALGHYRDIPWKTVLLVVGAVIYFVNPIDLLPDFIPVAGLADDFGILLWVYNSVHKEIDKFILWERTHIQA